VSDVAENGTAPPRGLAPVSLREALRRDRQRYAELGGWAWNTGYWIGATYRLGVWARTVRPAALRIPLRAIHRLLEMPWLLFLNVSIQAESIGPGLCLIHPRNVLIGGGTVLGEDCLVFHEVTFGTNALIDGKPLVGNRVDVYVGARVLGRVVIGDDAMIGANCVVTRDVPPGYAVLPAKAIMAPRALLGIAAKPKAGGVRPPGE
jgi:serine O-acetyltransferase